MLNFIMINDLENVFTFTYLMRTNKNLLFRVYNSCN